MLVINYNGNKPITDYFKYSVQGNSEIDVIRFSMQLTSNELEIKSGYNYYAKVECEDDGFVDKIPLSEVYWNNEQSVLTALFHLKAQHTMHKQISVSFCAEKVTASKTTVWQTQLVKVNIANGIDADEQIEDEYPTILQDYGRRITALEQGGGGSGGGVNDVKIEKIYLRHQGEEEIIQQDYIVEYKSAEDKYYCNQADQTYVCLKTTPISNQMLEEIKAGRFVIRFNYPVNGRKRGFTNQLSTGSSKMNAVIFIHESDVYTNAYGEKYIYWEETFVAFVKRFFEFTGEEDLDFEAFDNNQDLLSALNDIYEVGDLTHFSGVPSLFWADGTTQVRFGQSNSKLKGYNCDGYPYPTLQGKINIYKNKWTDIKHNFWCPLIAYVSDGSKAFQFSSDFWRWKGGSRSGKAFINKNEDSYTIERYGFYVTQLYEEHSSKRTRRFLQRVCLKPSCAVIDLDYDNLGVRDNCWLKSYSKSEQSINLGMCGYMSVTEGTEAFIIIPRIMIG